MNVGETVVYHGKAWKVEELCPMALLKAGATKIWVRVKDITKGEEVRND